MPDEPEDAAVPAQPHDAADTATTPTTTPERRVSGTGRFPRPSRRQVWFTVALVAVVVVVGAIAVGTESHSTSTSTSNGPTPLTTLAAVPESNPQASEDAASLEVRLRQALGGCWDEAEPGDADGAYRQDYHFPGARNCGGSGWDIDIQIFATTKEASAAGARLIGSRTLFVAPYSLIILAAGATAAVHHVVAAQPGVRPAT